MLSPFLLYRAATFALFIVCNAIICSVAAWNLSFAQADKNHLATLVQIDSFLILAGAAGLVVVFTVIFVEVSRKGAVSSRVWFEMAWLTLFWMFNFAGATAVTAVAPDKMCSHKSDHSYRTGSACTSSKVLVAFSWLNTAFLFIYFFLLTVFSIIHQKEDASIWRSTIVDFPWFATRQCIRSAPVSPILARFVKSKSPPSLVVPKPRRAPPPPIFIHGRAGLSSQVEIEHFTDIGSLEQQPVAASPPAAVAPPQQGAAFSLYPQHVQSSMHSTSASTTYLSNTYYSMDRSGVSPPPIRNWPRPIVSNPVAAAPAAALSHQPISRSDRAAQKQRAPPVPSRSASDASSTNSSSQRNGRTARAAPPPPLALERTTMKESAVSAQDSPSRSRPTGPRTRAGSSGFVRPRPPPLDLTREGSTPYNSRR